MSSSSAQTLRSWLRVLPSFTFLTLFMVSTAAAQCGPDSCSSTVVCEFDGIQNVALGQAQVSLNGACNLVISNIGSSGKDGVSQNPLPPDSQLMITGLACPNFLNSLAGTEMRVDMHADIPFSLFSTMTATNTDGNTLQIVADFSPAGATMYDVTLFDGGGAIVGQWNNLPSGITLFPKNDIVEACCDILGQHHVHADDAQPCDCGRWCDRRRGEGQIHGGGRGSPNSADENRQFLEKHGPP
jgi:hypothetical protein